MIEIRIPVSAELAEELEEHFCEEYQQAWMLHEDWELKTLELRGFFETEAEAHEAYRVLKSDFAGLGAYPEPRVLDDRDWKEAYKLHFKPWSYRGLHWVPVWERDSYELPEGDEIVYLDPGMAFGTGNHETTRLCVKRLLDARDHWGSEAASKSVIDAGCGSGILAISARKAGFGQTYGFDLDPDSVQISLENAELCEVAGSIEFKWADLREGLEGRTADVVLANILANILQAHAEILLQSVNPGGVLVLSGILAREAEEVKSHFARRALELWGDYHTADSRTEGDWADVELWRQSAE